MNAVKDMDAMTSELLESGFDPETLDGKDDDEAARIVQEFIASKEDKGATKALKTDDEEITVKVKPSLLGSYLKGKVKERSPEEAVLEALKGKVEADRTIDNLKAEKTDLSTKYEGLAEQTAKLQKELDEWKAKQVVKPKEEVKVPELPEIPSNLDALNEEQMGAFLKTMQAYAKTTKELHNMLQKNSFGTEVEAQLKEIKNDVTEIKASESKKKESDFVTNQINEEYDRIRKLQKKHPEFKTSKDIQVVEKEYLECLGGLAEAAGIEGGVIDSKGSYKPEVLELMDKLRSEDEEVSKIAADAGIKLPEDVDTLLGIYQVRSKWFELSPTAYTDPHERYEKAFEYWDLEQKVAGKSALDKKMEVIEKTEKAKENLKRSVKTARQSDSEDMTITEAKVMDLFNNVHADDWTEKDIVMIQKFIKSQGGKPEEFHPRLKE